MRSFLQVAAVIALAACGGDSGGPAGPGNGGGTGTVRGTVNDNTGAPVPSASVALTATGQSARTSTTGSDGIYTFTSVPAGTYTVAITPPTGFALGAAGTATVTVTSGQQSNVNAFVLNRTQGGGPPGLVEVSMINTTFSPQQVEVAVGGTVRFTNNDAVQHNATSASFATGNMNQGQVREQTVGGAGTITYSCTIHPGMSGSIIVR